MGFLKGHDSSVPVTSSRLILLLKKEKNHHQLALCTIFGNVASTNSNGWNLLLKATS